MQGAVAFLYKMTEEKLRSVLDDLYASCVDAMGRGEIPVSAAVVLPSSEVFLCSNRVEETNDPFAHAEMNVLSEAMRRLESRYLKGATLVVSLEPCLCCMGAIVKAGIENLYYVLDDEKGGALSRYHAFVDDVLKVHRVEDDRFGKLMTTFFATLRK